MSANSDSNKVIVMVGTRKGGFVFTSDQDRKDWQVSDLQFKSWELPPDFLAPDFLPPVLSVEAAVV